MNADPSLERIAMKRVVELNEKLSGVINFRRNGQDDDEHTGSIVVPALGTAAVAGGTVVAGNAIRKDYGAYKSNAITTARQNLVAARPLDRAADAAQQAGVVSEAANQAKQAESLRAGAKSALASATPTGYIRSKLGLAGSAAAPVVNKGVGILERAAEATMAVGRKIRK